MAVRKVCKYLYFNHLYIYCSYMYFREFPYLCMEVIRWK